MKHMILEMGMGGCVGYGCVWGLGGSRCGCSSLVGVGEVGVGGVWVDELCVGGVWVGVGGGGGCGCVCV